MCKQQTMEESFINDAELLLFTKSTARFIKKIIEMYYKGKISKDQLKEKLILFKENIQIKFASLEKDDGLKKMDCLEYAIQEYIEQNDVHGFEKSIYFFKSIKNKQNIIQEENNLNEILAFCNNNKILLKELESDLKKKVNVQVFIVCCHQKKFNDAMQFIRTNQIPVEDIKEWLFLLIRDPTLYEKKISDHLRSLLDEYKRILCYVKGLPPQTRLTNRILAGIIALNSIDCLKRKNTDRCPTCLPWIQKIAHLLPYSRRTNTFLRCKGCDEEINESNRPLIYETKHIYSEKYLKSCGYVVYCIKTKTYCKERPEVCFFL